MLGDSVLDPSHDHGEGAAPRTPRNDQGEGGVSGSGRKSDAFDDVDQSLMIIEESFYHDDETHTSPFTSPRMTARKKQGASASKTAHNPNKVKLTNEQGQVRLTSKMKAKEKELRHFLSVQRNRTLRQSEKQRMIADFIRYIDTLVQIFRMTEKLDAAGDKLGRIFKFSIENGSSG
jgi:hypothetical protein